MTTLTTAKIALFVMAAILIGFGIRVASSPLRLTGIAFFAAAFALRFVRKDTSE